MVTRVLVGIRAKGDALCVSESSLARRDPYPIPGLHFSAQSQKSSVPRRTLQEPALS